MVLTWEEIYRLDIPEIARTFPDLIERFNDRFGGEYDDILESEEHDEL